MYSSDEDNTKRTSTGQYKFEITNHLVKKQFYKLQNYKKYCVYTSFDVFNHSFLIFLLS